MKRSLLYLLLALFFSFNITGCSLFGGGDDDTESATVAEEGEGDEYEKDEFESEGEEGEQAEGDETSEEGEEFAEGEEGDEEGEVDSGDEFADEPEAEDSFQDEEDEEYPDDEFDDGEEVADADSPDEDDFQAEDGTTGGDDDAVFVDEGSGEDIPDEPMSQNEEEDLFAKEDSSDSGSFYEPSGGDNFADEAPKYVPVKKMKAAAFRRAGSNVNRLYVARSGDDMSSIARKIYGSDRSSDLYKWNGHFQGKSLKVGDKVYYSSSRAPNDPTMKTYYEDVGIAPQYYTGRKGDNIRTVSEKLLGSSRSWMEVYATNEVDSKWALPAGTQLRYWPSGAKASMTQAQTPAPAPEPEPEMEEVEEEVASMEEEVTDVAEVEPEEVEEIADLDDPSDLADSPELDEADEFTPPPAAGSVAPPPPPQSGKGVAPPPPPSSPLGPKKAFGNKGKATAGAKDDSMIMGAIGGLFILASIILLIFIRRNRAKRVNFSQTQI